MHFNWIDWVISVVLVFFLLQGWETGLIYLLGSFISFLVSLWFALRFHTVVGTFLTQKFGVPDVWSTVLGYVVVAFIVELILSELLRIVIERLPSRLFTSRANNWLGALVSFINGLIIIAFILLIVLALPLRGSIKPDIKSSFISKYLIMAADRYGGKMKSTLDEVSKQAVKFMTIEPDSNQSLSLNIKPDPTKLQIDEKGEQEMIDLVNQERAKISVGPLAINVHIRDVARVYARKMYTEGYFAHKDPDGHDVGDRLTAALIPFSIAGENLAFAPDVQAAHVGLMNSPGHRRNVLDAQFRHIGIGIIDGGDLGKMFVQVFTD
jgi:uncharacterized protein YkwD